MSTEVDYWPTWSHIKLAANQLDPHYSLGPEKQEFLYKVCKLLPKYAKIVELGVCNGSTAFILGGVARILKGSYVGIDNWSLESSRDKVLANLTKVGFTGELIQGNTHDPALVRDYDFLLIDAGHDEDNVSKDCELWIPRAKPGAIVAFDDYPSYVKSDDPHWAVKYYADLYTGSVEEWELIGFWQGLMVRRKV